MNHVPYLVGNSVRLRKDEMKIGKVRQKRGAFRYCDCLEGISESIGFCFEWIGGVEAVLHLTDEPDVEVNMLKCREFDGCKIELACSE